MTGFNLKQDEYHAFKHREDETIVNLPQPDDTWVPEKDVLHSVIHMRIQTLK